jgi:hypothetical protein
VDLSFEIGLLCSPFPAFNPHIIRIDLARKAQHLHLPLEVANFVCLFVDEVVSGAIGLRLAQSILAPVPFKVINPGQSLTTCVAKPEVLGWWYVCITSMGHILT